MRLIISPAKQMKVDTDTLPCADLPQFVDRAEVLKDYLSSLSYDEQKKLWACNDKIASENRERFAHMDLRRSLTPALLAYDGIQYTYMAPSVFESGLCRTAWKCRQKQGQRVSKISMPSGAIHCIARFCPRTG